MTGLRSKILVSVLAGASALHASSLMGPVIDAFLRNNAARGEVSCVLSETGSRVLIYSDWSSFDRPVPLGSLVKPFAALAYAESHGGHFPRMKCTPQSGCWLPTGHGFVGIEQALAISCNTYFRSLSEQLDHQDLSRVTARFGLVAPARNAPSSAFWGLGDEWRIPPAALVRAYEELINRAADPVVGRILRGLKQSAATGTAAGVARATGARGALAKTGTAPCIHRTAGDTSNGDGYALVLYPAGQPRYTLLLRVHGVPGRQAANLAGEVLHIVTNGGLSSGQARVAHP